jgi:hypothetical protein
MIGASRYSNCQTRAWVSARLGTGTNHHITQFVILPELSPLLILRERGLNALSSSTRGSRSGGSRKDPLPHAGEGTCPLFRTPAAQIVLTKWPDPRPTAPFSSSMRTHDRTVSVGSLESGFDCAHAIACGALRNAGKSRDCDIGSSRLVPVGPSNSFLRPAPPRVLALLSPGFRNF